MLHELKSTINRSSDTLLQDALGAACLVIILVSGLMVPALI